MRSAACDSCTTMRLIPVSISILSESSADCFVPGYRQGEKLLLSVLTTKTGTHYMCSWNKWKHYTSTLEAFPGDGGLFSRNHQNTMLQSFPMKYSEENPDQKNKIVPFLPTKETTKT